jgi:hypothetical protein
VNKLYYLYKALQTLLIKNAPVSAEAIVQLEGLSGPLKLVRLSDEEYITMAKIPTRPSRLDTSSMYKCAIIEFESHLSLFNRYECGYSDNRLYSYYKYIAMVETHTEVVMA